MTPIRGAAADGGPRSRRPRAKVAACCRACCPDSGEGATPDRVTAAEPRAESLVALPTVSDEPDFVPIPAVTFWKAFLNSNAEVSLVPLSNSGKVGKVSLL